MKTTNICILCAAVISGHAAFCQERADCLPAITATGYLGEQIYRGETYKDLADMRGLHLGAEFDSGHFLEAEMDFISIKYSDASALNQTDSTIAYGNRSHAGLGVRCGGHFISSGDQSADGGRSLFGGVSWRGSERWDTGIELCMSQYPGFTNGLGVAQLTFDCGLILWKEGERYVRNQTLVCLINIAGAVGVDSAECLSVEDRVVLTLDDLQLAVYGWAGEQMFAVRNEGFSVFDLAEMHRGGYGAEVGLFRQARLSWIIRYGHELYDQADGVERLSSDQVMLMLTWKL